jgi:hypothetical protein
MRKTIASAIFLLAGAGAAALGANLRGSDTMEDVTKFMLNPAGSPFCAGTTGIVYLGGGSTNGEQAMTGTGAAPLNAPLQSAAPMSRALGAAAVCATKQGSPATAAGVFVCLDGLAIVGNSSANQATCDIKFATGNDWRDVLRLVYAGANASPDNTGAGSVANCTSTARRNLVNNWNSMFNAPCNGSIACTQMQHAWRRNDLSGTTDTFLSLLGLPAINTAQYAFCNAAGLVGPATLANTGDFSDNDPIRRACIGRGDLANSEQICNNVNATGADQNTLGLVQVVFVPETHSGLPADQLYATVNCSLGFFEWRDNPAAVPLCPYGLPPQVGACLLPYNNAATGPNFACLNRQTNRGFFLEANTGDGRVYNLAARRADSTILRDANNRRLMHSAYRIHTTRVLTGSTTVGCQLGSGTTQIGCLASASPCSIGFSGREALSQPSTVALRVKGLGPTPTNIQNLILNPSLAYPIARKLYYNSVVNPDIVNLGVVTATGTPVGTTAFRQQQLALKTCFANAASAKTACEASGFVEAPGGPVCEDFNEQNPVNPPAGTPAGCGAATNANACP